MPGLCTTGQPFVSIAVGEPKDDAAAPAALRYRVWVAGADGQIDYGAPPAAIAAARGGEILLGHSSICSASTFVVPDRTFKLGIKAVDLAGNASEPVTIDVSAPPAKGRRADVDKPAGEDK
jgi:hypothetical protein